MIRNVEMYVLFRDKNDALRHVWIGTVWFEYTKNKIKNTSFYMQTYTTSWVNSLQF